MMSRYLDLDLDLLQSRRIMANNNPIVIDTTFVILVGALNGVTTESTTTFVFDKVLEKGE